MTDKPDKYQVLPFSRVRQPVVDPLYAARSMNIAHALVEVDITDARQKVREFRKKKGRPLSFTAFLIYCLARAVDENRIMHAYRKGGKLVIFDQVDIAVVIERDIGEEGKTPIYPHVIKAANNKTLPEIHDEISTSKTQESSGISKWTSRYWYLPGIIRNLIWRTWLGSPYWRKKLTGTIGISALSMFGRGAGFGIPVSTYTLSLTAGGISDRPALVKGQVEAREYLGLTISFDHNIIDGAPVARFIQRLKELIEGSHGLEN